MGFAAIPTFLGAIGGSSAFAGGTLLATSAVGALSSYAQTRYAAKVEESNAMAQARGASIKADEARLAGEVASLRARQESNRTQGNAIVAAFANGGGIGSGSIGRALWDQASDIGKFNIDMADLSGRRQAIGFEAQKEGFLLQAESARDKASNAWKQSAIQFGTNVAMGAVSNKINFGGCESPLGGGSSLEQFRGGRAARQASSTNGRNLIFQNFSGAI